MAVATLPAPKHVKDLLEGLLGRDVDLTTDVGSNLSQDDNPIVACYVDGAGRNAAAVAVSLPLGVYLGAAMALTPPGGAQDMAEDGDLPPMIVESLYEIFNICSSLFHNEASDQVRLAEMYLPDDRLPDVAAEWLSSPVGRLELDVEVHAYGAGRLVLATGI